MALSQSLKKGGDGGAGGGRCVVHDRVNDNQVVATTMNKQDKCVE